MARDDPFDSLFNLEDTYYEEGFKEGFADGIQQSGFEAKIFGVEKGFEKFFEMGMLQARARIWAARLSNADEASVVGDAGDQLDKMSSDASVASKRLPILPSHSRLAKHVQTLEALVDPATLSTANSDEAVGDFDDRLKRAQAKIKIIEKLVGEETSTSTDQSITSSSNDKQKPLRDEANMEDFGG